MNFCVFCATLRSIVQLYSGQARLRFMAEIDKKVRLHMEKGNRRAPVGVRT